jgi:hypothetical protein
MRSLQHAMLDISAWLVEHDPLPVSALRDPLGEDGFDARSMYVETYWLPILGPSCVLVARRLVSWLEAEPDGFEITMTALAGSLGLGAGAGRRAPIVRTLARLADFELAHVDDSYALRTMFPPLAARQIARLPDHLAAAHAMDRAAGVKR